MGTSDIKAVVFDMFGTVVDWRGGIAREAAPFLARHGAGGPGVSGQGGTEPGAAEPGAAERFADAWRGRYQPAMEAIRSGRRPFVRLDVLHRENL